MTRNRRVIVHNVPYFITCDVHRCADAVPLIVVAESVLEALRQIGARWGAELHAYVVMPHHWHALIKTAPPSDISRVMNGIKTQSAIAIRRKMDAKGPIWQARFYDHVCRDHDEYLQAVDYVHRNPVEAGLVGSPEEWPWSSWFGYMGGGIPAVPVQLINRPFDAHWAEWHRHAPPWRRA